MNNPSQVYQSQINRLNILLAELGRKKSRIAWLRFAAVIAAFGAAYLLWPYGLFFSIVAFAIFFGLFLRLVVLDVRNKASIENTNTLININKEEIKIAAHQYTHRDDGSRFLPSVHDYASDLDIFGRASLYQYVNRTTSEQGNQLFSSLLLQPSLEKNIIEKQLAVKELSGNTEWRQQLQAYGIKDHLTIRTEEKLKSWVKEENKFLDNSTWKTLRYILPALSLLSLAMCIAGVIPTPIFLGIAFIFFIISGAISRKVNPLYLFLNKTAPEAETLSDSIRWIENISFKSGLLQALQQQLVSGHDKASSNIKLLSKILERFDLRLNPLVFIPLNILLFWDLQQAFSLEEWKDEHKENLPHWFHVLAEMETISTIANISFNHPDWVFPVLSDEQGTLIANDLGHPLIESSKRVTSSFSTQGVNQLALITGSNMAGKSTFLRSIGVNMILAMIGSRVCASALTIFPMKIMSSMRIADNLEENTSTFYAELKKLKSIIEAVNRNEKVFIILDEILRGTNSLDRHTGSNALIKQLIRQKAVGMIATHDLELARLEDHFPGSIHNYHFDVQVANDELYFDYKLKEGICQSMNASILMKKIGIEL